MGIAKPPAELQHFARKALPHIHYYPGILFRITQLERVGQIIGHVNPESVPAEHRSPNFLLGLSIADKQNSPGHVMSPCDTSTANHTLKLSAAGT